MTDSLSANESIDNIEILESWIPRVGMEFDSVDHAWNFWLEYGGKMGFNVRKQYENKRKKDGQVTSRRFVCSKEGFRQSDKRDHMTTNPRAETRTGCKVRIGIILNNQTGKYVIHEFVSEHNHVLHSPETTHLLSSQRKITEVQATEIDIAYDSGIRPRVAHDFIGAHVGGSTNLGYTHRDHKNYLRTKRQRDYKYGEAGILLRYFHLQTVENPSFQYSIQLDCEEQITNIFWADAKMLIDYASFGDVVAFDTTFGTNTEHRPLGVFVGFNHFRETTVFGAALLYDETIESFKWLFETFLATHGNKHPKTLFTDQDIAMGKAIEEVMPTVCHGLCTWHITENATKHLLRYGSDVLNEFKACMYEIKEETEFEKKFEALRGKVTEEKKKWLNSIYSVKNKWAECYMKNVFSLGMRSTQLSESFNRDLKDYLKCTMDIMRFFKQFERVVGIKRQNETNNEFESREKLPRLKMRRNPLLMQVSQIYTPIIFEAFQDEYDWSTAALVKPPVEGQLSNEYTVVISDPEDENSLNKEYQVLADPLTETISCSCKMFERLGILCCHALKVLDTMNIKLVPKKYILKRWTREARTEIVRDIAGKTILEDPQLDATRRYKALCTKFVKVASRASNFVESSTLLENELDNLTLEVEKLLLNLKLDKRGPQLPSQRNENEQQGEPESFVIEKMTLKPKQGKKGGKRRKSWTEKFHDSNSQASNSNQAKKGKKKVLNHTNRENIPPQEGDAQMVNVQQLVSSGCNYQIPEVPYKTYTQLLLCEDNGTQASLYCDLWRDTPISSQAMNVQDFSQLQSQSNLSYEPNDNWIG